MTTFEAFLNCHEVSSPNPDPKTWIVKVPPQLTVTAPTDVRLIALPAQTGLLLPAVTVGTGKTVTLTCRLAALPSQPDVVLIVAAYHCARDVTLTPRQRPVPRM